MGPTLCHVQARTILESSSDDHRWNGFMGPPKPLQPVVGRFDRYLVWMACIDRELGQVEGKQGDDGRRPR